jgi:tetratricopeptide (TPR) repeat protein
VGRHEAAVELAQFSQDEEVARAAEFVVRYGLGDQERAVQMSLERLRRSARSIADALELATLLSREGDVVGAAELVREGIPTSSELAGPQQEAVRSIVARGAARAFETRERANVLAALSLIEWANENQPPLGYAMHEARIALISRSPDEGRVERMLRAVEEAGGQHPEQRARAVRVAIDALRADESDQPLRLARELALRTEPDAEAEVDPLVDALFLWGREVCLGGGSAELREFVENTGERFRLAGVTEALLREAGEPSRAQLAYAVAVNAASLGRMDAAMEMYRVVLELDPDHGMALNDLGYFLITERGDIEAAEPMLERAYRLHSDSSNVVDSLGWLRYKQGKLADFNEDGERKLGAVTLLTRAKALHPDPRRQNPNILEHLGDALWASGDYEAADQEWSAAMRAARIRRREAEGVQAEVDRLSEQVARLARKIAASNRGERPEIEPRIGEQDSSTGADSDGSSDETGGSQPESPNSSNTSTDR